MLNEGHLNIWKGITVKGGRYCISIDLSIRHYQSEVPPKTIKDPDQILYNFIWRRKNT